MELPLSVVETHLPEHLKTETAVLQGAVDCVFEEDGALVIVDFKTDRVKHAKNCGNVTVCNWNCTYTQWSNAAESL